MKRRAFLGALASGGAVGLAGCTGRRRTLTSMGRSPEIPSGGFHHETLEVSGDNEQVNLRYEVTADGTFDTMLFGGPADPEEFAVYRRAVDGETDAEPEPSDWHTVLGAEGTASVNRPLRSGTHHFVVDNTDVGEASPDGTLRPTIDLSIRKFKLLSV